MADRHGFGGASARPMPSDPAAKPRPARSRAAEPDPHAFQRDRDRILHSTAFRRLTHKTQVFVYPRGRPLPHAADPHPRSRADRPLASRGRCGSTRTWPRRWRWPTISAIRRSAMPASARSTRAMRGYGGFDHNAQTLRVVTGSNAAMPRFDGLNLTWETLEGLVKHNGPLIDATGTPSAAIASAACRTRIADYRRGSDLRALELRQRRRRRSPRSPTTSPTTLTTSTTGCAPACFTFDELARGAADPAGILREMRADYPGLEAAAAGPRADAPR